MDVQQEPGVKVAGRTTGSSELCPRGPARWSWVVGGSRVVLRGVLVPARPALDAGRRRGHLPSGSLRHGLRDTALTAGSRRSPG